MIVHSEFVVPKWFNEVKYAKDIKILALMGIFDLTVYGRSLVHVLLYRVMFWIILFQISRSNFSEGRMAQSRK